MEPTGKHNVRFRYRPILYLAGLIALMLSSQLPADVRAQRVAIPTSTRRSILLPTKFILPQIATATPTKFTITNVLPLNVNVIKLSNNVVKTKADLNYSNQFGGTVDLQSPSAMLIGESRVISLRITPSVLAQTSFIHAELKAVSLQSTDDGQPEKQAFLNIPVEWSWSIAPTGTGEQEFFIAISYRNNQGSSVHWQNIPVKLMVAAPATPTTPPTGVPSLEATVTPSFTSLPPTEFAPSDTPVPTATRTTSENLKASFENNPAPYLTIIVTLLLGLLGIIVQVTRKK